jgi:hypothetical protein
VSSILHLQRTVGNQAVKRRLQNNHLVLPTGAIQRQPEARPPEKASVSSLRQELERQIDLWEAACKLGIAEFVHEELANRIDSLSEGSWDAFFKGLVGNTVWAAAAFVPAGGPAFALSMAGIFIAMSPSVPKKSGDKDDLKKIEDQLYTYIETVHRKLNNELPSKAVSLLKEHPGISVDEGVMLFLEASFRSDMIKHSPPMVDETPVRQRMRDTAAYALSLSKEISTLRGPTGADRTMVAWLTSPDLNDKKLAVVESAPIGAHGSVKFLRWVPEEDQGIALETQRVQNRGFVWEYGMEQQVESNRWPYLQWLVQHGWKTEDGFGWEWLDRKEKKAQPASK